MVKQYFLFYLGCQWQWKQQSLTLYTINTIYITFVLILRYNRIAQAVLMIPSYGPG